MLLSLIQRICALVSLAVLAAGAYLIWSWYDLRDALEPLAGDAVVDTQDWRLWTGGALLAWSFLGRLPISLLLGRKSDDGDRMQRQPGVQVETPDGASLHVEANGPQDAPVLVFVHGWGLDAGMWWEARRMLSERYEVVTYDLAGLGKSTQPADGRYSLDRFADDLATVVGHAGRRKVILIGHSIGGMTVQTFCRRHPEMLGRQVAGVVLENTTHIDPTRTTVLGKALFALKPVIEPLTHLDIWLQPIAWLMAWQGYLSGSTHIAVRFGGFGTTPTKAQLQQVALCITRNSPAVQAKGNLAMMHWGVSDDLPSMRIPALVFIGGGDLLTRPSAGETIGSRMPWAREHRVPRAGHMGPLEFADEYNRAIADFADEIMMRGAQSADQVRSPVQTSSGADDATVRNEPRPFA
jgi:pimeloyl-ACP methyl ester carboxylesterase